MAELVFKLGANGRRLFSSLCAAVFGFLGTYASQQLSARSSDELIKAGKIITRLERQVGTVIGSEWQPLSASQIEELRLAILTWHRPTYQIQVMYENEFGKDLAESIATAFRAAGWKTLFSSGAGFGRGIEVGPGPEGAKMQEVIARLTQSKDVRTVRPEEPEMESRFVGVGAKVD